MTTVRQLIDHLFKVEDLDQPVVYEYYLKEHFHITRQHDFAKDTAFIGLVDISDKAWAEVAEAHDNILVNDSAYTEIEQALKEKVGEKVETNG